MENDKPYYNAIIGFQNLCSIRILRNPDKFFNKLCETGVITGKEEQEDFKEIIKSPRAIIPKLVNFLEEGSDDHSRHSVDAFVESGNAHFAKAILKIYNESQGQSGTGQNSKDPTTSTSSLSCLETPSNRRGNSTANKVQVTSAAPIARILNKDANFRPSWTQLFHNLLGEHHADIQAIRQQVDNGTKSSYVLATDIVGKWISARSVDATVSILYAALVDSGLKGSADRLLELNGKL